MIHDDKIDKLKSKKIGCGVSSQDSALQGVVSRDTLELVTE